jgi:hypothetical protein
MEAEKQLRLGAFCLKAPSRNCFMKMKKLRTMGLGCGYENRRVNGLAPMAPEFGGCLQFEEKTISSTSTLSLHLLCL